MKKLYIFDMDGSLLDVPLPDEGKLRYAEIKGVPYGPVGESHA